MEDSATQPPEPQVELMSLSYGAMVKQLASIEDVRQGAGARSLTHEGSS